MKNDNFNSKKIDTIGLDRLLELNEKDLRKFIEMKINEEELNVINELYLKIKERDLKKVYEILYIIKESIKYQNDDFLSIKYSEICLVEYYMNEIEPEVILDEKVTYCINLIFFHNKGNIGEMFKWSQNLKIREILKICNTIAVSEDIYTELKNENLSAEVFELCVESLPISELKKTIQCALTCSDYNFGKKVYKILKNEDINWMKKMYTEYLINPSSLFKYKYKDLYLFKLYMDETIKMLGNDIHNFLLILDNALSQTIGEADLNEFDDMIKLYDLCKINGKTSEKNCQRILVDTND